MSRRDPERRWREMRGYEDALYAGGLTLVAGVDEAGRGPLAGPVTAAAVILPRDCYIPGLNDSKQLSEAQRLRLEPLIREQALASAVVFVNHRVIDEINILNAAKLAMTQAIMRLDPAPEHVLIDAVKLELALPQTNIIKGDCLSVSIAAASILAKNSRDRLMLRLDQRYPDYGFARHKGYPTAAHKAALAYYGPSPVHRRSFRY